jgi:signal transduction histidine kinase
MARRLTAPLAGLVTRAEAIGHGDFAPAAVSSGIPEIDGVSQVLERSAQRVAALVALQRDFAADAAHQLRTPLTGIALRLEEVVRIGDEQVRQEAEGAVTQVERLDRVITSLLARARGDSAEPTLFDLAELVQHEAVGWGRVLAQHHRPLVLDLSAGTCVVARREHLVGILTSLLDNALVHGWGPVHVGVARSQEQALLIVRDEGPGVPAALAHDIFQRQVSGNHGTGIGLALASSLAVAEGGLLELSHESATFVLTLPSAPRVGQR